MYIYRYFFVDFHEKVVFLFFSFLFLMKYQLSATEYNQSKTGSGDKNLSLELLSENVFLGILIVCSLKVLCI